MVNTSISKIEGMKGGIWKMKELSYYKAENVGTG